MNTISTDVKSSVPISELTTMDASGTFVMGGARSETGLAGPVTMATGKDSDKQRLEKDLQTQTTTVLINVYPPGISSHGLYSYPGNGQLMSP